MEHACMRHRNFSTVPPSSGVPLPINEFSHSKPKTGQKDPILSGLLMLDDKAYLLQTYSYTNFFSPAFTIFINDEMAKE